ncbi:VOC family protein [Limibaculum sp. M0105]|uniref:VOC family protein n=2 Tax=Thermohalobaculum xanthum TaxID=2753746 RepID=A0A8J7M7M5_9RHOB|nr:VOC family protein [Thermohalobaculum xanthum]
MITIDHLSVGVPDIAAGRAFYDQLLAPLEVNCLAAGDGFAAYGRDTIQFLLLLPFDGGPATGGNGTHIGFAAPSREAVEAGHAAGLKAGGKDEGAPGERAAYPMPGVFAAYVRDPWGNKIELIHGGFSVTR